MVDTLARPDQDIDPHLAQLSERARIWPLIVACLACSWSSPRWSRSTPRCPTSPGRRRPPRPSSRGSSTATPWCWPACCCPRVRSATDTAGAGPCCSASRVRLGVGGARDLVGPDGPHHRPRRRRSGRRLRHARDTVTADRGIPKGPAQQGGWHLGGHRGLRRRLGMLGTGPCCTSGRGSPSSGHSPVRALSCSYSR